MLPPEWTRIFRIKAQSLKQGDSWHLEYDENIEPDKPNMDWKQYIRNTGARFKCSVCRRQWPSNKVMVIFHMCLRNGQGTVKVRQLRQNCKMCSDAPMEEPSVESDNIHILMENLVEKIKQKCYHKKSARKRHFRSFDVNSPHEPKHCEGCIKGVCTR
ncbi:receptor-transporting protein 2-like [Archocentrus centrarchus]|uniref:receptor-transporting protein 2-like n=1 Tax=Archocentrus centrarchus TaxID=63155 RepID=UPI0011EA28FE|nr:receptor-transporting protein 2-like [Archocentrus centrarchus]